MQQNAFVKLISRSHFKIILHNRRLKKADFFVGRSLLLFYASVLYSLSELGNKRFRRISFLRRCQKKLLKHQTIIRANLFFSILCLRATCLRKFVSSTALAAALAMIWLAICQLKCVDYNSCEGHLTGILP